jgi:ornithine cyclodeaminase/alanine dehydrogenase-like protein (mu-crystallin family)
MTLVLSEKDVQSLLNMDEVVSSVEEAFRQQGMGNASNYMRTRSWGQSSVQNVMHANLSYLGRAGLKAYIASGAGVIFSVLLFDSTKSEPLAIMGADHLGRFRTGAASGVATKYLYGRKSGTLAILGSGRQAFTQALAVKSVMSVDTARVWSPDAGHRDGFCLKLKEAGFRVSASDSPGAALDGAELVCSITSSAEAFVTKEMLGSVAHMNLAGGNVPTHAEISTGAVGLFKTVVVDDIPQGRVEYGDLIQAAAAGTFSWDSAVELASVVSGKAKPSGRTLFKSGGVALEDVAVASMLFDKAMKSGNRYPNVDLR